MAVGGWITAIIVVSVLFIANPSHRTVTHLYHDASAQWAAGAPLYEGPSGMNYLPHFALVFAPFYALPTPGGDLLWRLISAAVVVWGVWRLCRLLWPRDAVIAFPWVLLLTLPLSLSAMRYGQANGIMAGLLLNCAASMIESRWWAVVFWIALAIMVKPIALVIAIIAACAYPATRWRLLQASLIVVALPFLFGSFDYVLSQYTAVAANLSQCASVTEHRFADFQGILRTIGVEFEGAGPLWVRVAALVGASLAAATVVKRLDEPRRGLWVLTLSVVYLMLFNPMNESNSYAIFAPVISLWAVWLLSDPRRTHLGWSLVAVALSMSLLPEPLRPLFGNSSSLFFSPLMAVVFLTIALRAQVSR